MLKNLEQTKSAVETLKAYALTDRTIRGLVIIYAAATREKAMYMACLEKAEAGYKVRWIDFRAKRVPMYDSAAVTKGLSGDDYEGWKSGCLAA